MFQKVAIEGAVHIDSWRLFHRAGEQELNAVAGLLVLILRAESKIIHRCQTDFPWLGSTSESSIGAHSQ